MELTHREHRVVTNIWGDDTPDDLRKIDTQQLVEMHDCVTDAVQLSYDDEDIESLRILLSLEPKIIHVLTNRLPQTG